MVEGRHGKEERKAQLSWSMFLMKLVNHTLVSRTGLREVKLSGNEAGLLFQRKIKRHGISSAAKLITT